MQRRHFSTDRTASATTVADSSRFSVTSALSANDSPVAGEGDSNVNSSHKRKSSRRKLKIGGFNSVLKLPLRRKALSEPQLRKRVKKSAQKSDWDSVRRLILNYEFSELPEVFSKEHQQQTQKPDSLVSKTNPLQEESKVVSRRPSYGENRHSFTGSLTGSFTGESVAAAAAIKAAVLEDLLEESVCSGESTDHDHRAPYVSENILHDVCRCRPPLDVLETLLKVARRESTSCTDDLGRTPLHLAADCGASYEVIDALVRADPCPASMADVDRRSPLHLAVKFLACNGCNSADTPRNHKGQNSSKNTTQERTILIPQEALERTYQSVLILKDAMLTSPGRISFKDEDETGYSPLDYAIDGNITMVELIQSLSRRKEPRIGRRRSSLQRRGLSSRSSSVSSISDDQDIEILRKLEQDEVKARRHRLEKIKARQQREVTNDSLFDVFGIEEEQPTAAAAGPLKQVDEKPLSPPKVQNNSVPEEMKQANEKMLSPLRVQNSTIPEDEQQVDENSLSTSNVQNSSIAEDDKLVDGAEPEEQTPAQVIADNVIYNQHLQDYLDDFMDDLEGCDLEYCDQDDFDITDDPEARKEAVTLIIDDSALLKQGGDGKAPRPLSVVIVSYDDDDCVSVMSDVTALFTDRYQYTL